MEKGTSAGRKERGGFQVEALETGKCCSYSGCGCGVVWARVVGQISLECVIGKTLNVSLVLGLLMRR